MEDAIFWVVIASPLALMWLAALTWDDTKRDKHGLLPDLTRHDLIVGLSWFTAICFAIPAAVIVA